MLTITRTLVAFLAATAADPWTTPQLLEPKELVDTLRTQAPLILMVGPRVLYDGAHIPGARYAGPANTTEGLQALIKNGLPLDTPIVIYCGCCPMTRCPNIRPAFAALRDAGYKNVKVLNLIESMHADWTGQGYPIEKPH